MAPFPPGLERHGSCDVMRIQCSLRSKASIGPMNFSPSAFTNFAPERQQIGLSSQPKSFGTFQTLANSQFVASSTGNSIQGRLWSPRTGVMGWYETFHPPLPTRQNHCPCEDVKLAVRHRTHCADHHTVPVVKISVTNDSAEPFIHEPLGFLHKNSPPYSCAHAGRGLPR